jgi:putative ABC transport system permease protein
MLERTRELGVFMATGASRYDVATMLLLEAVLIGFIGSVIGVFLGLLLVYLTGLIGIDLSILLGSTSRFYVDPVVYPSLALDHLGITLGGILLASLLSGLYPSWRAMRLQPVEAIRNG